MRKVFSKGALAAAAVLGLASSANAYVVLTITDLSTATTVTCNSFVGGCGSGFGVANNAISFAGSVGAFDIGFSSGTSNAPGNALFATSNTATTTVFRNDAAAGTKSLVIDLIAFDFFNPTGLQKTMEGSATPSNTIGFNSPLESVFTNFRVNSDNGSTAPSFNLVPGGPVTSFSCTYNPASPTQCFNAGNAVWNDPASGQPGFSMRTQQSFNILAGTSINSSSSLTVRNVPEPLTVSLVGAALLAAGVASRRKATK